MRMAGSGVQLSVCWACLCLFVPLPVAPCRAACGSVSCVPGRSALPNGLHCIAEWAVLQSETGLAAFHGLQVAVAGGLSWAGCLCLAPFPGPRWALAMPGRLGAVLVAAVCRIGFLHSMLSMLTPSNSFRNSAIFFAYCVRLTFISMATLYLPAPCECCSFML